MAPLSNDLIQRLHEKARADRWHVPLLFFAEALEASLDSARSRNPDVAADASAREKYLRGLHLEDLALACACRAGLDAAWEHFIRELRPVLYRAADALDASGGARELADSIYADLYGTEERDGRRRSLFRYFHGRSSIATWLRAVLAQRHVDAIRAHRRFDEMPEEEPADRSASNEPPDPDRARFREVFHRVLSAVIAALLPRDRLRLALYYGEELTLAQIGRITREHEATVSRHLARTRRAIRGAVAGRLRRDEGLDEAQVEECFEYAVEDPGALDLGNIFRKNSVRDRSNTELP
jgi:RNA polymerase sigma-70 factor (ECF subfamily)